MIRVHDDWSTPAFEYPAVALGTGPFTRRPLLEAWWRLRRAPDSRLLLVEGGSGLLPLWQGADGVSFLGEEDLTDYHSPLGTGIESLVTAFAVSDLAATPFRFDSLPAEAAEAVALGLAGTGITVDTVEHECAAVLDLPASYDEYLTAIGKKQRHELRRKRRRFEAALGEARLLQDTGPAGLEAFFAMHRSAPGDKGAFMTAEMEGFFTALAALPGARLDLLAGDDGPVAGVFGFQDASAYYLYNSAYDPEAAASSPGMVLLALLIEDAIMQGMAVFDFLKGDEVYKFRLGARRRPLYVIEHRP